MSKKKACKEHKFAEWLRSETLNMMQKTMRDNAYNGQCLADFILICEEKSNDKNYYEKWLIDNGLKVEINLYEQKEIADKLNTYEFHVRWHYRY